MKMTMERQNGKLIWGYVPRGATPRTAIQAGSTVHGRGSATDSLRSRATHLSSHVWRDVGALLGTVEAEAIHIQLIRHIG
jgi:hypothetical protein